MSTTAKDSWSGGIGPERADPGCIDETPVLANAEFRCHGLPTQKQVRLSYHQ